MGVQYHVTNRVILVSLIIKADTLYRVRIVAIIGHTWIASYWRNRNIIIYIGECTLDLLCFVSFISIVGPIVHCPVKTRL